MYIHFTHKDDINITNCININVLKRFNDYMYRVLASLHSPHNKSLV